MEKTALQQSKRQSIGFTPVDIWSVQCVECFKWRVIPTQDEYEEIRSKLTEAPFVCSRSSSSSCDDPADIEYDTSRTWVIDKPGIPKTPPGFKRRVVMRKDFSKMDCYYDTPNGKRMRASTEVSKFLENYPEYSKGITVKDFAFASPRVVEETVLPKLVKN